MDNVIDFNKALADREDDALQNKLNDIWDTALASGRLYEGDAPVDKLAELAIRDAIVNNISYDYNWDNWDNWDTEKTTYRTGVTLSNGPETIAGLTHDQRIKIISEISELFQDGRYYISDIYTLRNFQEPWNWSLS